MSFHEVRFPAAVSFGSSGGPERLTEVVTLANGHEERNAPWKHSRRRYDAGVGVRSLDDIEELISFFEARSGRLYGFRWKDWSDYKSCLPSQAPTFGDQIIGAGDGETVTFGLAKTYRSGPHSYTRRVQKPVAGSVRVGVQGGELAETTEFTVDFDTGLVTFVDPPESDAEITAGFEFDVPVRFDTDRIYTSLASFQAGEIPDVPVVELRL
ncbi:DUF2460 domain-containing protein [Thalassobacter stenotrophicus]|uniref:DUF2460 domain-containing protein n=1 Tax=Thalassobacter stenotrophicus TaxID=266809 RepID=UPI0022A987C6|nr:DUF2460 domain-containing protein [Thalassobacter stenotrophicus]UYP68957.1 DUF2460 domain-containing protein [Thalassobacter stenotrophicus]